MEAAQEMNRRSLFKSLAGLAAAPLIPKVEQRFEWKECTRTITIDPGRAEGDATNYDLYRISADGSRYMKIATAGPIRAGEPLYWEPTRGELIRREFVKRQR